MEPVNTWSPRRVALWLQGLDSNVQKYPFDQWQVNGQQLLRLSPQSLEELGVKQIGHQELILEAVELLCALTYDLETENLKVLMEKLRAVSGTLQSFIISRRKVTPGPQRTSGDLLSSVIDLLQITKAIFSWLNRYPFICIINYTEMKKEIIRLCVELTKTIHKEYCQTEKENWILSICRELSSFCERMVMESPEELVNQRACLETIHLLTTSPGQSLGIEIKSNNGLHFITGTALNSPAQRSQKIRPGDEVVQVNDMVVVGWTLKNLVAKLRENPSQVVLVMKKLPLEILPSVCASEIMSPHTPQQSQLPESLLEEEAPCPDPSVLPDKCVHYSQREDKMRVQQVAQDDFSASETNTLHMNEFQSVQTDSGPKTESVIEAGEGDCLQPEMTHNEDEHMEVASQISDEKEQFVSDDPPASPSPGMTDPHKVEDRMKYDRKQEATATSPLADDARSVQLRNRRKKKGVATALSRRRISCRDLGLGECYGWLWKKKEYTRFMSQKWKRCWFILKGHTLYWYNSENDEKAEGLIKLSSYSVEAAGEHKRKFVFQLYHRKFKSFVFSAENVVEMSKWINSLIGAIQKYKTEKNLENKEEDCWSETETEESDDSPEVPSASRLKPYAQAQRTRDISPTPRRSAGNNGQSGRGGDPGSGPSSPSKERVRISEPVQSSSDELEVLMKVLEQGGVSLLGKEQSFRKDYHQSFVRRNKNPVINEKVHNLRALKSTLKAKIVDLQSINKILDDPNLTAAKFRHWKEENQELLADIQKVPRLAKKGPKAKSEDLSTPETDLQLGPTENPLSWFDTGQILAETSASISQEELENKRDICSDRTVQLGSGDACEKELDSPQDLDIDRIQRCL
ncbi:connector enhancer of kinase suppressor of ras 1 isoform X1 [Mobula birostris]|uniref:connector enhancer of kinase suppressor of ras 1 isoform X1 n=1 Tax=Mobula birostris TaxID=1983395 RepID=UPI003B27BFED